MVKLLQHRIRRRLRNRSGYVEEDHTRVVDQETALTGATDAYRDRRNRTRAEPRTSAADAGRRGRKRVSTGIGEGVAALVEGRGCATRSQSGQHVVHQPGSVGAAVRRRACWRILERG